MLFLACLEFSGSVRDGVEIDERQFGHAMVGNSRSNGAKNSWQSRVSSQRFGRRQFAESRRSTYSQG